MNRKRVAWALACLGVMSLSNTGTVRAQGVLAPLDTMRLPSTALLSVASTPLVLGLLRDLETTPYQAALGAVRFANTESKQTVSVAPFRILDRDGTCNLRCSVTVGLSSSKSFSSISAGWTFDKSTLDRSRLRNIIATMELTPFDEAKYATESDATKKEAREEYFRTIILPHVYADAYDALAARAWSIGISANYQFFPALKTTALDADGNGKVDEAYATRGAGVLLTMSYAPSLATSLQLGGGVAKSRASAEAGKPLRRTISAFAVARQRLHALNPKYRTTPEWFEDMFIPAIYGTLGLEWQKCTADVSECDAMTNRSLVLTPAVEIRLAKATQFRIGMPFGKFRRGAKNSTELTPTFQFGLLLSAAP